MDVLAELSYVSMTPDHFPSMFCKVWNKGCFQTLKKEIWAPNKYESDCITVCVCVSVCRK